MIELPDWREVLQLRVSDPGNRHRAGLEKHSIEKHSNILIEIGKIWVMTDINDLTALLLRKDTLRADLVISPLNGKCYAEKGVA